MEEAAQACDERSAWASRMIEQHAVDQIQFGTIANTADECAELIRALKSIPPDTLNNPEKLNALADDVKYFSRDIPGVTDPASLAAPNEFTCYPEGTTGKTLKVRLPAPPASPTLGELREP